VSDTGIGISEARWDAIFESFTQEDMSTTRKYGGTGLGLSISRQLVEMMGGEIRLTSQIGAGSVFSFEIPFDLSSYHGAEAVPYDPELGAAEPEAPDTPKLSRGAGPRLKILLVEDNLLNQVVAKQRLNKLGHQIEVAGDSFEALDLVRDQHFDCILMDIQMPGKDGYQTTGAIRELEKREGRARQYVVAMTAHAMKGDQERCLLAGMDDYIAKPFRVERVKEILDLAARRKVNIEAPGREGRSLAAYLSTLEKEDFKDLMAAAQTLIQALPDDIRRLSSAAERNDYGQCYFIAHNLKSVVGHFGHGESVALAEALEQASDQKLESDVQSCVEALIGSLDALTAELETELRKAGFSTA
jgi:CheY-like chemotaxis protein